MAGHIEERKRNDGTVAYRLKVAVGKRHYVNETMPKGTTREQAERRLALLVDAGLTAQADATLSGIWAAYERNGLSRLTPGTRTRYRSTWKLQIEPHLGPTKARRLSVGEVEDWLAELLDGGLAWHSVRNAKTTLGALLTFAARREMGVTQPHVASRARMPGEAPVTHVDIPEPAQVAKVLASLIETDLELATFERIAAVTGARRGEVGALRLDDIAPDGVMLDEAVRTEYLDGNAIIDVGPTKTKHRRFVEIDAATYMLVQAWILHAGIELPRSLLFATADGAPIPPWQWSRRWKRACKLAGITTTQHALRHLAATLTADALGVRAAQERLGHAHVTTTERYAKMRGRFGGRAADVMAAALLDAE